MTDAEREALRGKQIELMKEREQLEALQTQRSDRLECFNCLEWRMQTLDEQAEKIRWMLEGDGDNT